MKKILLFLICIAMIISAVPTIAMEEPENVIEDIVCGEEKVSGIITNTKCDTTGVQVSVVGDTHTTFGGAESILDGLGMTTVTDGSESPATFDTSVGNKKWRWTAKDSTVCPIFTIKLSSPIELSRIDFTEARKTIEGYTVTLKNNGTTIKTFSGSFSDSTTTNALYLRKIQLGEKVTADEIIFEVTFRASNSSVMSITEMELILESSTKVSISNANFHASSGNTITVQHTVEVQSNLIIVKDSTKNKSSNRVYPLLSDVREILLRIKIQQEEYRKMFGNCYTETDYVFARPDGKMYYPSYPSKLLKKTLLKTNLKYIRFHDLRHSCASMLIMKGWQMKDISDWLGHADINTTMNIYGHLSMEYKRKLGQQLENLL